MIPLSQIRLIKHTAVSLVTSGYTDRYLSLEPHFRARVTTPELGEVRFDWITGDASSHAIRGLQLLTGETQETCFRFVQNASQDFFSRWQDGDTSICATVRPEVIEAIAKVAVQRADRPRFTEEAAAAHLALARTASELEKSCARWWLAECNRTNALTQRPQVAFPEPL